VNEAREQVLARSGLAEDQHAAVRLRRAHRLLDAAAQRRMLAADHLERARPLARAHLRHRDQCRPADGHERSDAQLRRLDRVRIDERAVARPAIPHHQRPIPLALEHAMDVRDEWIDHLHVAAWIRAEHPAAGSRLECMDLVRRCVA